MQIMWKFACEIFKYDRIFTEGAIARTGHVAHDLISYI